MDEAREVSARHAMSKRQLDLSNRETRPLDIDGHPKLAAETARDRKGNGTCALAQKSLSGERLTSIESAAKSDERPGCALRESETSTELLRERADRQVVPCIRQGCEVSLDIGVAEQQWPRERHLLGTVQRLALPETRARDDDGARRPRLIPGSVSRAVVGNDDRSHGKTLAQARHQGPDPTALVASSDQNRETLAHG